MFKFEEICELIRLVGSTRIAGVEVEHAGSRLRIDGSTPVRAGEASPGVSVGEAVGVPVVSMPEAEMRVAQQASNAPDSEPREEPEESGLHYVTSPIVGTFYRAPNPDADPYVKIGDPVAKGQVMCIVEAMKLMNEIESDTEGTIVKIFPENSEPVEFGARLFAVKPA
jgi:acetyl-CoA carboxylase biotin carboxyl carrier protein